MLASQWTLLDKHRIDKYCTLISTQLRECFVYCAARDWDPGACSTMATALAASTCEVSAGPAHLIEVYLTELSQTKRVGADGL